MVFTQSAIGAVTARMADWMGEVTLRVTFSTGSRRVTRLAAINMNAAIAMKPVQASVRAVIRSVSCRRDGAAAASRALRRHTVAVQNAHERYESREEYSPWGGCRERDLCRRC